MSAFYESASHSFRGQGVHLLDHSAAVRAKKASGKVTPRSIPTAERSSGLSILRACTLLQNLPLPPAASMLHCSKTGIMADFMLYINPNNYSTLCKCNHALCVLIYPCCSSISISFSKAEGWSVVFLYHILFTCSLIDG